MDAQAKNQFNFTRRLFTIVALLTAVVFFTEQAYAISSTNYKIEEDSMGAGSGTSESTSYSTRDNIGLTGIGDSEESTNYDLYSGKPTPDEPYLAFAVNTSSVDLGTLSSSSTQTATATFSVKNYVSTGYIVQAIGSTLTNSSYTIDALSSQTASSTGTEQFGFNLVANTSPVSFGADPSQNPDSSFSFGQASTGYNTANAYKFVSGDTIAQATKSSGQTDYTISYIANITNYSAAGEYSAAQTLICTGTY